MFDQTINSSVTVKTIFIVASKWECCPVHLPWVDAQLLHVVERLCAGWSQPAIKFSITPLVVLQVNVLVPAGSIEEFLWAEQTWCLFMSSNMNLKTSRCLTVHITYATYKTWSFTCFCGLCWGWWMFTAHVLLECVPVLVGIVTLLTYKMQFTTMVKQIPEGIEYQTGAKYTIIWYSWMDVLNMFHPSIEWLEIPVTNLTLNLVLVILAWLTNSRVPLVSEWIWIWCADYLHRRVHFWVHNLGDGDLRSLHPRCGCMCHGF